MMALIKRNTATSLDAAQKEYASCQAAIGELHSQRMAALADDAAVDHVLLQSLRKSQSDALRSWPANVERPLLMDFSTDKAGRVIERAMRAFLSASLLDDKVAAFAEELTGFADAEAAGYAELVDDLLAQSAERKTEQAA
jgi:hypothetical protein